MIHTLHLLGIVTFWALGDLLDSHTFAKPHSQNALGPRHGSALISLVLFTVRVTGHWPMFMLQGEPGFTPPLPL